MKDLLSLISFDNEGAMSAISAANGETAQKGLVLTPTEMKSLCETYQSALTDNRIVEFGAGGVTKIQKAFASSDFVDRSNFAEVVEAMTDTFYFIKREVDAEVKDDTVIAAMLAAFDDHSHGSVELFQSRDAEILIRYLNEGRKSLEITGKDDYDSVPDDYYEEN